MLVIIASSEEVNAMINSRSISLVRLSPLKYSTQSWKLLKTLILVQSFWLSLVPVKIIDGLLVKLVTYKRILQMNFSKGLPIFFFFFLWQKPISYSQYPFPVFTGHVSRLIFQGFFYLNITIWLNSSQEDVYGFDMHHCQAWPIKPLMWFFLFYVSLHFCQLMLMSQVTMQPHVINKYSTASFGNLAWLHRLSGSLVLAHLIPVVLIVWTGWKT